jgi:hypothetical protein
LAPIQLVFEVFRILLVGVLEVGAARVFRIRGVVIEGGRRGYVLMWLLCGYIGQVEGGSGVGLFVGAFVVFVVGDEVG